MHYDTFFRQVMMVGFTSGFISPFSCLINYTRLYHPSQDLVWRFLYDAYEMENGGIKAENDSDIYKWLDSIVGMGTLKRDFMKEYII